MTGEQRFRIGFEICDFVMKLVVAGIRFRNPGVWMNPRSERSCRKAIDYDI